MIKNIIMGNENLNLALAQFSDDSSEENFLRIIANLAEAYDMDDQFFVAFDGDTFQSIREDDGDYLVMFTSMDAAELGPDTDLMIMDLDNLIGNVLIDEEMAGFVIDPFSECVFIDRDAANVVRSVALSGPVIEVMKDISEMDMEEKLWLAESIEKGEDGYVPNKVLAAVLYNEIADEALDQDSSGPDDEYESDRVKAMAMVHLGKLIMEGAFFERDEMRARELFSIAADKLNTDAMVELGKLEEGNGETEAAASLYQKASMMGNMTGLMEFGRMKLYGLGVPEDRDLAEECFLKAAEDAMEPEAYYYLGLMAEKGMKEEPDLEKAEYYYNQGADFESEKCRDKMIELFGGFEEDGSEETETDDEEDPYIFDFSKGPRNLRS